MKRETPHRQRVSLTADRPRGYGLRDRQFFFFSSRRGHTRCGRDWSSDVCSSDLGAAQSMPQGGLFGRFVRTSESLPVPEASSAAFRHLRAVVSRAIATATGRPSGPVQLNVPFREPLAPVPDAPLPPGLDAEALE